MTDKTEVIAEENTASDENPVEVIEVVELVEVVDVVEVAAVPEATIEPTSVVEEPVAEAVVEEPVAEAVVEEPVAEAVVEEPVAEAAVEEPVAEAVVEEPVAEAAVEEPVAEAAVEEPVAEAVVEEPVAEAVVEEPVAEATAEKPVAAKKESAAVAASEKPASDGPAEVRVLSVGQEVTGKVKRIADFGAFVDIGVGRDGLLHISELSINRVGKVADVLTQGQEITGWIKELDRERNRISLTMISPDTKTIRDLSKDDLVEGTVSRMENYGAFIDIGIGRDALLHVREMASGYIKHPGDVVKIGETVEARIIEISRRRSRVDLSIKGLRPEPEAAVPPKGEEAYDGGEEVEMIEDPYENVEVLSPMELAFKRAMGDGGDVEATKPKSKKNKSAKKAKNNALQEEILERTLKNSIS